MKGTVVHNIEKSHFEHPNPVTLTLKIEPQMFHNTPAHNGAPVYQV